MRCAEVCAEVGETNVKSAGVLLAQAAAKGLLQRADKGLYVITPAGREKLNGH